MFSRGRRISTDPSYENDGGKQEREFLEYSINKLMIAYGIDVYESITEVKLTRFQEAHENLYKSYVKTVRPGLCFTEGTLTMFQIPVFTAEGNFHFADWVGAKRREEEMKEAQVRQAAALCAEKTKIVQELAKLKSDRLDLRQITGSIRTDVQLESVSIRNLETTQFSVETRQALFHGLIKNLEERQKAIEGVLIGLGVDID